MKKSMKRKLFSSILTLCLVFIFLPMAALADPPDPLQTVTDLVIEDAIAPINGAAPKTTIAETEQYTGAISWAGDPAAFAPSTYYTATITLSLKDGYTFEGIAADAFSVSSAATATNDADSGVITVTFLSPPNGYISDGNGVMAYRYGGGNNLDIKGFHGGSWLRTTYADGGYRCVYVLGETVDFSGLTYLSLNDQPYAIPGSNLTVHLIPSFANGGKAVKLTFQISNNGADPEIISIAGGSDVQIGNNDLAPMTLLDGGRGFMMFNGTDQFNFFGINTVGVTNVDAFWFGNLGSLSYCYFTQQTESSVSGVDSAMSYSWHNKTIAPGQVRNFSVLIGIGGAGSEIPTELGVLFDSLGGSDVPPVTGLTSGDLVSAPTPPTRDDHTFGGWYTEPECTNPFDFATPITETITLYAKWTEGELEVIFDSRGGGDVPPVTGLTSGDTVSAPTPPTRDGHTFGGWYTEPECTNPFDFATPITETITLYAKWTEDASQYPVTDANQNERVGGQTEFSKELAEAGETVRITVTPYKGYENGMPIVLDGDKKPVAVTDNGDGTFDFKMPAGGVTVETEFTRIDYFDDVDGDDWYDEASWFNAAHGLMKGTGHRQFDGHIGASRAMLVTVLYRLANGDGDFESIFADVKNGKWYSGAIGWAAHHNIVKGYGNGKFGPHDTLTREQMVTILYRYSVFMKYDVSKADDLNAFSDADGTSQWALEAMKWAVGNGIVEGVRKNVLSPGTGGTRAQLAMMMQRYVATFVK